MSPAPASAMLSIVAAPSQPVENAASAAPLDATQTSAFSRMLDAEASLAQAVSNPSAAATSDLSADSSPTAGMANDVALALAQAAHAGLSPLPAPVELPDLVEAPDAQTALEQEVEGSTTETTAPAIQAAETAASPLTEIQNAAAELGTENEQNAVVQMQPKQTARETSKATPELTFNSDATQPSVSTNESIAVSDDTEEVNALSPQTASSVPNRTSSNSTNELADTEVEPSVQSPAKSISTAAAQNRLTTQPAKDSANADNQSEITAFARTPFNAKEETPQVPRVSRPIESEEDSHVVETPVEFLLNAAGVLNTSAPRDIQVAAADTGSSEEVLPQANDAIESDFGFTSVGTPVTKTFTTATSDAFSERDFAPDTAETHTDFNTHIQTASDAAPELPVIATNLGEVRVIASQSSRKEVLSIVSEGAAKKEIEIQPLRTELRAMASDEMSEAQVPATDRNAEAIRVSANGEKIARQSSPEGFSLEAGQREISASAITAPFVDGGRPETIASRNSAESTATPNTSRAERLLDHTLDAIPNPLRVTTFEIKPEGHGTIRVRISARGEGEKAVWRVQIQTSDPAARSLLSEHLNELRERLPAENVQVELRGANDLRPEVTQRENGESRERNGEQRQSRGSEQRQPKQQKSGNFLEWLAAQE